MEPDSSSSMALRRQKNLQCEGKIYRKFHVLKNWMLPRSFEVLHGGLRRVASQWSNNLNFFNYKNFYSFGNENPRSESEPGKKFQGSLTVVKINSSSIFLMCLICKSCTAILDTDLNLNLAPIFIEFRFEFIIDSGSHQNTVVFLGMSWL